MYIKNNIIYTMKFTKYVCVYVMYVCMYALMYDYYNFYVGFDYTYININALAQGIKFLLVSQVWFHAVAGARTYGTDSPAISSQPR